MMAKSIDYGKSNSKRQAIEDLIIEIHFVCGTALAPAKIEPQDIADHRTRDVLYEFLMVRVNAVDLESGFVGKVHGQCYGVTFLRTSDALTGAKIFHSGEHGKMFEREADKLGLACLTQFRLHLIENEVANHFGYTPWKAQDARRILH